MTLKPDHWGGLQFDFGKFYTSAGAELTENNLTWSYGRGYLYTNGPYYHFGARMTKPVVKNFAVELQIVTGPEKTGTNEGRRHFYDTVVNVNPTPRTSFYANFDYGRENKAFGNSAAEWIAIGVAGRVQAGEHTALALRYENYNDRRGFITGVAQTLQSFTATGEHKWTKGLLARPGVPARPVGQALLRARFPGSAKIQDTLTLGFVAYFTGSRR